jgi:hypothetical protein
MSHAINKNNKHKHMKAKFNLIVFLMALTFLSCKNDNTFNNFKFAKNTKVINCNDENLDAIVNEALFSFEDDITKFYGKGNPNINTAYAQFVRNAIYDRVKYTDIVSSHTAKVFEALKNYDLWDAENPKSYLKYDSPFFKCLAENIKDKNLKTTLNALVSTNSMSPKLFGSPLMTRYRSAISDKYLASYIAFDLYYAKLFNIDLSNIKEEAITKEEVDFNKVPK